LASDDAVLVVVRFVMLEYADVTGILLLALTVRQINYFASRYLDNPSIVVLKPSRQALEESWQTTMLRAAFSSTTSSTAIPITPFTTPTY
jgi:hypothetical protein